MMIFLEVFWFKIEGFRIEAPETRGLQNQGAGSHFWKFFRFERFLKIFMRFKRFLKILVNVQIEEIFQDLCWSETSSLVEVRLHVF